MKQSATPFAPRKSSLPNSPEYIPFERHLIPSITQTSFADRLSRPTRASQLRATESKTYLLGRGKISASAPVLNKSSPLAPPVKPAGLSMVSLNTTSSNTSASMISVKKGIKNRFSAMLNGRRRAALVPSASEPAMNGQSRQSFLNSESHSTSRRVPPRNITTSKNSSMNRSPVEEIRSSGDGEFLNGEQVDQMAKEDDDSKRKAEERFSYQAHAETNQGRFRPSNTHHLSREGHVPGDEEEPPTPPHSSRGPLGHYNEESEESGIVEEDISETLARLLREAEQHYHNVATIAENTADPEARQAIGAVLAPLANSIEATRAARISVIALGNAIERLAAYTVLANVRASNVAIVTSNGIIPPLPPAHPPN